MWGDKRSQRPWCIVSLLLIRERTHPEQFHLPIPFPDFQRFWVVGLEV